MTRLSTHHDALIDMACQGGWTRGHAWRSALYRSAKADPFLWGEWAELKESIDFAELPRPDAWRIVIEGPDTLGTYWRYNVLVVELLEVEVTSGITESKDEWYRWLWDIFDATAYYHLRIWHMDRFGVIRPYIINSPVGPMVFGMNAGWRS